MQQITLHNPLDMHLHLRDGELLEAIAKYSATPLSGALIMPNLVPPITTKEALSGYRQRIGEAIKTAPNSEQFKPYLTLFFDKTYKKSFLAEIKDEIIAIKLYPAGITTNSENGVDILKIDELKETLSAMSELNIPLCVHGESSGFVMDREKEFLPIYESLAKEFPNLQIIMEHITTKDSVQLLDQYDNLFATITLHHLMITLDDVAGGLLRPHLFCKPIAKREEDKLALLEAALHHKKAMFGSDSAPHPKSQKECCGCAAGVFSAPMMLEKLTEIFDQHDKIDNLQAFISDRARAIYGITPPTKTVTMVKETMQVAKEYDGIVPLCDGEQISWRIKEIV